MLMFVKVSVPKDASLDDVVGEITAQIKQCLSQSLAEDASPETAEEESLPPSPKEPMPNQTAIDHIFDIAKRVNDLNYDTQLRQDLFRVAAQLAVPPMGFLRWN